MAKLRLLPSPPTYTRNPKVLPKHLIKTKTPAKVKAKVKAKAKSQGQSKSKAKQGITRIQGETNYESIGAETLKTIAKGMNAGYIYVDKDGIIGDSASSPRKS